MKIRFASKTSPIFPKTYSKISFHNKFVKTGQFLLNFSQNQKFKSILVKRYTLRFLIYRWYERERLPSYKVNVNANLANVRNRRKSVIHWFIAKRNATTTISYAKKEQILNQHRKDQFQLIKLIFNKLYIMNTSQVMNSYNLRKIKETKTKNSVAQKSISKYLYGSIKRDQMTEFRIAMV